MWKKNLKIFNCGKIHIKIATLYFLKCAIHSVLCNFELNDLNMIGVYFFSYVSPKVCVSVVICRSFFSEVFCLSLNCSLQFHDTTWSPVILTNISNNIIGGRSKEGTIPLSLYETLSSLDTVPITFLISIE